MQSEEGYLYEVSQLMYCIIETDNLESLLRARFTLDTSVYPRMSDYGFNSKRELRDSVHYWRAQQPDPTKQLRAQRLERWGKEGMTKWEMKNQDAVKSGSFFKEHGGIRETIQYMWSKFLGKEADSHDDLERD